MGIGYVVLYGLLYELGEYVSNILQCSHSVTVLVLVIYVCVLFDKVYKNDRNQDLGLQIPKEMARKKWLLIVPVFLYTILNIYFGMHTMEKIQVGSVFLTILVVLFEELYFRGYLFHELTNKTENNLRSALISSSLFAVLHVVTFFSYTDWTYIVVQILCAFSIGMCLCGVKNLCNSIVVGIVIHCSINITGMFAQTTCSDLMIYAIAAIMYIAYAMYLMTYDRKSRGKE